MQTFTIKIGGEAGQGLVSVGNILLKAIAKEGWYLFAHQDYESRIRGGHNFFQIRLGRDPVYSWESQVDVLVALDAASIKLHRDELKPSGVVLYDPSLTKEKYQEEKFLEVPFVEIAQQHGQKLMANAAAAGAVWALLSNDSRVVEDVLTKMFSRKGTDVVEANKQVASSGFSVVASRFGSQPKPAKPDQPRERVLMKGNDALPLGALAAGLKFMSAYPMTPSTGVTEFVARHASDLNVVMEQAEDEISAINMTIGAAYTGVRAMTATSGGGFALMTEGLGLAGSAEIPVVVIDAQRPGPSTGLPTRTEQGDLLYAFGTSSGDFPKAILAPGDIDEAFYMMGHAFNLAERYQMPVIVLSDQHLADSQQTIEPFDLESVTVDRGEVVVGDQAGPDYKRYAYTDSGISPRLYPGFGEGLVVSAGDEHDEAGHLIEDATTRSQMMEKRMTKMRKVAQDSLPPVTFGDEQADIVLISFGSTKGALRETIAILTDQGVKAYGVHLPQVCPLPSQLESILLGPGKKYVVESNYTGQLAKLITMEFAIKPDGNILRYDGRPLNPRYILERLEGGIYCE